MPIKTESCLFNKDLNLLDRSNASVTLCSVNLTLIRYNNELIECRLIFQVSPQDYQYIDTKALFNLKPQMRGSLNGGQFLPESDFEIEVMLKPNLLFSLKEQATNIQEIANYIIKLSQEQPEHPLLFTENWLCLSVKQPTVLGQPGYRTFWADVSPSVILQTTTSSTEISAKVVNFFKEWIEVNSIKNTQQTPLKMLEEILDLLKEFADFSNLIPGNTSIPNSNKLGVNSPENSTNESIFTSIINFFTEDGWPFTKVQGQSILKMDFQGENGKWTCYAKAREEKQHFVFYSVSPLNAPENKIQAIAEFITRVNYGTTIGNFELDFNDGEIRYKTSIDVEGDRLTTALIKRLVYANVMMMDEYLPGILSVIYGNVSPADAIAQIEND